MQASRRDARTETSRSKVKRTLLKEKWSKSVSEQKQRAHRDFTKVASMSAVGFEPTSASTVELESTPLDRSGTLTKKGP